MINIAIALIGTAYSALTDIKTGYVSDPLAHLMIAFGAVFVILAYPLQQALWIYAIAVAVFGLGFAAYSFGQIGGGDVKLFTALSLLIPFWPLQMAPIDAALGITPAIPNYPFIVSIFLLSGIIYMFFISIIYLRKIYALGRKIEDFKKKTTMGFVYMLVLIPLFAYWMTFSAMMIILFFPMALTMLLIPFKDDMVKHFFAMKKKVEDLDDDDVLALECIDEKTIDKLGLWRKTFTPWELKKIKAKAKKAGIRQLTVCENLPKFVPYILAALVLNLLFGDLFFYIILTSLG
jgi:hypothetical protein